MYSEVVEIIINGEKVSVEVYCEPNMPEGRLKQLAIAQYFRNLKTNLYKENGLDF